MANQPLSLGEIIGIVKDNSSPTTGHPPPQQFGPVRWFEKESKCQHKLSTSIKSTRCGRPTYAKIFHIPYCTTHLILEMNRMLFELLEGRQLSEDASSLSGVHSRNFKIVYEEALDDSSSGTT